eukprot:scaffold410_cov267-Chaetoceros_neogracile.AAC.48
MGTCMSKSATTAVTVTDKTRDNETIPLQAEKGLTDRPPVHPVGTSDRLSMSGRGSAATLPRTDYVPGYSSGASTPSQMDDTSVHSSNYGDTLHNPKSLKHSASAIGLEQLIDDKKNNGLANNIVHMEIPFGKPIEEVYDGVHDGPVLGSGISGLVRLCKHKKTGSNYAVKCLDLGLVETDEGLQQLREEIAIMCQLDHPNIV